MARSLGLQMDRGCVQQETQGRCQFGLAMAVGGVEVSAQHPSKGGYTLVEGEAQVQGWDELEAEPESQG